VLLAHLAVDRVDGLLAAGDLHLDLLRREGPLDVLLHAVDDVAPVPRARCTALASAAWRQG
jgi:hypothetical protein